MSTLHGIYRNGIVTFAEPVSWPAESKVLVRRIEEDDPEDFSAQSNEPVAIARWIAEFLSIPPVVLTPEEEAAWAADREARKHAEIARDRAGEIARRLP